MNSKRYRMLINPSDRNCTAATKGSNEDNEFDVLEKGGTTLFMAICNSDFTNKRYGY